MKQDELKSFSNATKYSDIFEEDVEKQFEVMSVIFQRIESRNKILRSDGPLDPRERNINQRKTVNLVIRKAKKKPNTMNKTKCQKK